MQFMKYKQNCLNKTKIVENKTKSVDIKPKLLK